MDKISHIVGQSPRVASTDVKNAPAVRPGAPSFGRPIGESPRVSHEDGELSTAQRTGLLRDDLAEQKKLRLESKVALDTSNQFFNRPENLIPTNKIPAPESQGKSNAPVIRAMDEEPIPAHSGMEESLIEGDVGESRPSPSRYSPRGSYIDVRA